MLHLAGTCGKEEGSDVPPQLPPPDRGAVQWCSQPQSRAPVPLRPPGHSPSPPPAHLRLAPHAVWPPDPVLHLQLKNSLSTVEQLEGYVNRVGADLVVIGSEELASANIPMGSISIG